MTAHSVLNVRAAPEWGNSELYKYYERNGLGYGTVQTKHQLLSLPSHSEGLPHQTGIPMKIPQQELPVEVPGMLGGQGGTTANRLGGADPGKAVKAMGRYFVRLSGVYKGTHPSCIVN